MADALLYATLRTKAEALEIVPTSGRVHRVSLDLERGPLTCLELESTIADAVVARFALIAGLDFTASGERTATIPIRWDTTTHSLRISVRPTASHLAAEVRVVTAPRALARDVSPLSKPQQVGDYELFEELGRGALGVVYRARHRLLERPAAVKIWSLPNTRVSRANAALVREARAAAATRHPGVVDVYDLVRLADGRMAMVLELLDGESLATRLARERALQHADAVDIARRIAEVLEATSAVGIVHRDLKPENVYLLRDGRLKVLDFGAAQDVRRPDEAPGTLGTPWYMAPEQGAGGVVDARADLYSLGCILFEMLTGQCPFDSHDPRIVMAKHQQEPVPLPESPHGALPEALERLVMRALEKRPEHRHQSPAELVRELSLVSDILKRPGFRRWLPL